MSKHQKQRLAALEKALAHARQSAESNMHQWLNGPDDLNSAPPPALRRYVHWSLKERRLREAVTQLKEQLSCF